jgi:hypothetical protein
MINSKYEIEIEMETQIDNLITLHFLFSANIIV